MAQRFLIFFSLIQLLGVAVIVFGRGFENWDDTSAAAAAATGQGLVDILILHQNNKEEANNDDSLLFKAAYVVSKLKDVHYSFLNDTQAPPTDKKFVQNLLNESIQLVRAVLPEAVVDADATFSTEISLPNKVFTTRGEALTLSTKHSLQELADLLRPTVAAKETTNHKQGKATRLAPRLQINGRLRKGLYSVVGNDAPPRVRDNQQERFYST